MSGRTCSQGSRWRSALCAATRTASWPRICSATSVRSPSRSTGLRARRSIPPIPPPRRTSPGDEIGKSGVERIFESELRGVPGVRVFEVNRLDEIVKVHDDTRVVCRFPATMCISRSTWTFRGLVERELRRGLDDARRQEPLQEPDAPRPPDLPWLRRGPRWRSTPGTARSWPWRRSPPTIPASS